MKKICHVTSVHRSNDTRILKKQCTSLARHGYNVHLVAKGDSYTENGVAVVGVPDTSKNRFDRMLNFSKKIYKKALEIDADIYHLHDPELLRYALKLKKKGKTVFFDSHEDYGDVLYEKHYLPKFVRGVVSKLFNAYFKHVAKKVDAVICCYHQTEEILKSKNRNVPLIFNFPILPEILPEIDYKLGRTICYAGELMPDFNHANVIKAIENTDIKYVLAGRETQYIKDLLNDNTEYRGMIPFEKVQEIYASSQVGMCVLSYIRQCGYTKGNLSNNKFFEYMLAGMPIICTDFELWKEIVEKYNCGICVKPDDITKIREAILYLLKNPDIAKKMGENGRKAVLEKYNWKTEETKLLELYSKF